MSVIAISQQAPCTFRASRSMKIGFAHFRTQDQPVTPTIHVLSLTVTLKGSLYITFGPRFSRNFLFAFENGTIIHPSRPSQHRENDLPSGALPTICHPHQYSPKLPHLSPTFATPLLTPTKFIDGFRCRLEHDPPILSVSVAARSGPASL